MLISPLRPPLLLAKQIATLDAVSGGRTEIAWGVGWHEEEFLANGSAFEGRFAVLEEQVAVCRAVWGSSPASHPGPRHPFDDLHSMPLPPQGRSTPIWLGVSPSRRNIDRIVRLADGWAALPMPIEELVMGVATIRVALEVAGRDRDDFPVRAMLLPVLDVSGAVDRAATLRTLVDYEEAGATMVIVDVQQHTAIPAEADQLVYDLVGARSR